MRCLGSHALVVVLAACGGGGGVVPGFDGGPETPDAPTTCPEPPPAVCDYFLSCGCDTPTEKCSVSAAGPTCFNAGTKGPGEACVVEAECAAQNACLAHEGDVPDVPSGIGHVKLLVPGLVVAMAKAYARGPPGRLPIPGIGFHALSR